MSKTIAIDVGHSAIDGGAYNNRNEIGEFQYNNLVAPILAAKLQKMGYTPIIVYRKSYSSLVGQINNTKADLAISLHCNAFNEKATGTETLYYHGSPNSRRLAGLIQKEVLDVLSLNDRGIKPRHRGDRGYDLLVGTNMPMVIVEPFFIDNDDDLLLAYSNIDKLANAYAKGIDNYF